MQVLIKIYQMKIIKFSENILPSLLSLVPNRKQSMVLGCNTVLLSKASQQFSYVAITCAATSTPRPLRESLFVARPKLTSVRPLFVAIYTYAHFFLCYQLWKRKDRFYVICIFFALCNLFSISFDFKRLMIAYSLVANNSTFSNISLKSETLNISSNVHYQIAHYCN